MAHESENTTRITQKKALVQQSKVRQENLRCTEATVLASAFRRGDKMEARHATQNEEPTQIETCQSNQNGCKNCLRT